jgi:23S rRNA-/tRNA-specific pseudouridylate synthase
MVFGKTRDKGIIRRTLQDARRKTKLDAVTRYRTVEAFKKCSLLDVTPETGRKHQIRRHLQGIGHAVVGDTRYRPRGKPTVPAFPGRLWLHAAEVTLPDGRHFKAALPSELADHLKTLRAA